MSFDATFAWTALLLLGAFHGINPGMGWLFAVALGLQEQQRAAVWRSLLPLAAGHALAIAAALALAMLVGLVVPLAAVKWGVAAVLLAAGVFRLFRTWHPRYGGMRVGPRDLTIWSFLMASAHGAGLMVLPFVLGAPAGPAAAEAPAAHAPAMHEHAVHAPAPPAAEAAPAALAADEPAAHADHAGHAGALLTAVGAAPGIGLLVALVHTLGYLLVMGLVAVLVYEKLGLRLLQKAWLNLDLVWAAALIATAVVTVLL